MKIDLTIRPATLNDAPALADIYRCSWLAAYDGLIPDDAIRDVNSGRDDGCRKMLADPSSGWHFLALRENIPVGLVSLCRCRNEAASMSGEIRALYLRPEYWRYGYGAKLLKFAEQTLKASGFDHTVLWVLQSNLRARRFYEANGFFFDGASKHVTIGTLLTELRYSNRRDG